MNENYCDVPASDHSFYLDQETKSKFLDFSVVR